MDTLEFSLFQHVQCMVEKMNRFSIFITRKLTLEPNNTQILFYKIRLFDIEIYLLLSMVVFMIYLLH